MISPRSYPGILALASALLLSSCNGKDGGGLGPVKQVGNNLDFEPNNTITCRDGFPIQVGGGQQPFMYQQGFSSCTLLTFFPGAQPTAPGVVVSANIRVGNATGPMRFVRMRILQQNLFSGPNKACCSAEEFSDTFTPTPNSISTVPLNFSMTEEHPPAPNDLNTIAANDLIALEVLAPQVAIPGSWVNFTDGVLTLPNYVWFPALSMRTPPPISQNLRSEGSYSGFLPSYNLNFQAAASSASPTAP
jgi:hypothetical protein